MIGPRTGLRVGVVCGVRTGTGVDQLGGSSGISSVPKDATSGIYCPVTLADWNTVLTTAGLATGLVSHSWTCQDASGNLVDHIGSLALTAANTPSYGTAVSGWTRKAVSWSLNSTSSFSGNTEVDFSTGDGTLLMYQYASTPGATKAYAGLGNNQTAEILSTGKAQMKSGVNVAGGVGSIGDGTVRPIVIGYSKLGSAVKLYTDADKIAPTFTASGSATIIGVGSFSGVQTPAGGCLLIAFLPSVLSDANLKTLLQTLGFTISWT